MNQLKVWHILQAASKRDDYCGFTEYIFLDSMKSNTTAVEILPREAKGQESLEQQWYRQLAQNHSQTRLFGICPDHLKRQSK